MESGFRRRAGRVSAAAAGLLWGGAAVAQSYELPLRANDLGPTERYSAGVHSQSNPDQVMAKDIGARRLGANDEWEPLKEGKTDDKVLANWVVYGRPFYAIAPGTVVGCWRNAPENPVGGKHPELVNGRIPNGGNGMWVLQDDGNYVLYAHARPGSVPSALCPHNGTLLSSGDRDGGSPSLLLETKVTSGARVTTGQKLGEIGNSGDSSAPHLHVHITRAGLAQPMRFKRGLTTPLNGDTASIDGPWTPLTGKEMPAARLLIWAPHRLGNYTFNGVPTANYQRMVEHLADSGLMPDIITCKSNGASYDSRWVPAAGTWSSFHGMSAQQAAAKHAELTAAGFKRTSSYTCGSVSVAVWRK
jgi:hypothetical protein